MGGLESLRLVDADELRARVSMRKAIKQVQRVLHDGFDPEDDLPRTIADVRSGQLLLMPSELGRFAGQKLGTVAPSNPTRGLNRIQALYVLIDAETLTPVAMLDGTELTSIRTPAVSAAVVDLLAEPDAEHLVVFGAGPQAIRHVEAMRAIRPIRHVVIVGRDQARAQAAADTVRTQDVASDTPRIETSVGSPSDVEHADLIVCATTAREPIFDDELVADHATIAAVGSHEPDARELPGTLVGRSQVVVESMRVALTDAGDIVQAIREGHLAEHELATMAALFSGAITPADDRPRIVKTCGMGWQDLVVASLAGQHAEHAEGE